MIDIATTRDQITAKLTELRRRETRVRTALAPLRYLANPWLGFGVAAFVGYRIGRPTAVGAIAVAPAVRESLTRAIVRVGVIVIAQGLARRAVQALVDVPAKAPRVSVS
jgi:hypothetical protein